MYPGPEETVPGVFVRDTVIFDWEHGNGFHSLPMDADGAILDATIGQPASAGCIRVSDSATLYAFAEVGMTVVVR
jgi:lipoprotein-anchoring transpeptidase ErfK/SrfK